MLPATDTSTSSSNPKLQLQDFVDHLRYSSPFASNRVSSLADAQVHVDTIHETAWKQLVQSAEEARRRDRGGLGAVVWGDPGVGKSHLLARFAGWTEHDSRGVFVLLHNILSAPQWIPRYLLKCVVSHLAPPDVAARQTALFQLIRASLRQALERSGKDPDVPISATQAWELYLGDAHKTVFGGLPAVAREDAADLLRILFRYYGAAHFAAVSKTHASRTPWNQRTAVALRALRGEPLDTEEAADLGTSRAHSLDDRGCANDQWVEAALLVLLELARQQGMLVVICFDQVENLSEDRFIELMRFNHALLDHGRNLLVVTSGVRSDMIGFRQKQLVPTAAWDRISEQSIDLLSISSQQARRLLDARLQAFLAPFCTLPAVRDAVAEDNLFPLGTDWLEQQFGNLVEVRPRDALSWAHQRWREQSERLTADEAAWWSEWTRTVAPPSVVEPANWQQCIDDRVEQKLHEHLHRRQLSPNALPPDQSNLCGLITTIVKRCLAKPDMYAFRSAEPVEAKHSKSPAYDLLITSLDSDGKPSTTGVTVLVTENATSAAACYRRIVHDPAPPDRVVIIEDGRQPVPLATKGREYRAQLESRGSSRFQVLVLSFDEQAQLDALETVRGDAHSGDLEIEQPGAPARHITTTEVEDSHHRCGRYRNHPLLQVLLAEGKPPPADTAGERSSEPPRFPDTEEQLRQYILGELQLIPGLSSKELAVRWGERNGVHESAELQSLQRRLETIAEQLHAEDKLHATAADDDLYLLLKPT